MSSLEINGNFQIFQIQVWEYNWESTKMIKGKKLLDIRVITKLKGKLRELYRVKIKVEIPRKIEEACSTSKRHVLLPQSDQRLATLGSGFELCYHRHFLSP